MVCEKCGSTIMENDNFCGSCGAQILNSNDKYQVYNYNERQAKDNGVYVPYGKVIKNAVWLSLFMVVGAILIGMLIEDGPAMLIVGGVLCVVMISIIVVSTIQMSTYVNAPLLSIVYDESEDVHYVIQHPLHYGGGWDTASRAADAIAQGVERDKLSKIAQIDTLLINAVEKYKIRAMERSALEKAFVTPDQIVIKLVNPRILKANKKQIVISYDQENKRRKKIKIANAYPGFSI